MEFLKLSANCKNANGGVYEAFFSFLSLIISHSYIWHFCLFIYFTKWQLQMIIKVCYYIKYLLSNKLWHPPYYSWVKIKYLLIKVKAKYLVLTSSLFFSRIFYLFFVYIKLMSEENSYVMKINKVKSTWNKLKLNRNFWKKRVRLSR